MNIKIKKYIEVLIVTLTIALFYLYPFPDLDESARRTGCLFLLAGFLWVFEWIPIYATSLLILLGEILLLSDKAIFPIPISNSSTPVILGYKEIFSHFASPIIFLFLGGLFLARAASKYKLDLNLARILLKISGSKSSNILLTLMIITGLFSMFMSNTATTAMILSIVFPIALKIPEGDPLKKALFLAIPIAANVGGMGTPIGTPPNAVALAALEKSDLTISFSSWMLLGCPFAIVMIFFSWNLLKLIYKSPTKTIEIDLNSKFNFSKKAIITYITFGSTILLWLFSGLHGLPSAVVAFIPVVIFSMTGVIDKKDLQTLSWDILWLISGGLALGSALAKTGFNTWLINLIPFAQMPSIFLILGMCLLGVLLSTFISNTATANLLVPIALSLSSLVPSGPKVLPVLLAFSCSLAMALPISTPPNALAYGTGYIDNKDLVKIGSIVSLVGYGVLVIFSYVWQVFKWI